MISYGTALEIIAALPMITEQETIPLCSAAGRILARDLIARVSSPPFTNSAMDGYAFRFADLLEAGSLQVKGQVFAERSTSIPDSSVREGGGCIRINTGGVIPNWADTVVPHEAVSLQDGNRIRVIKELKAGDNVRRQGEDIPEGAPLLSKGTPVSPEICMILAAFGYDRVAVYTQPEMVIGTSGDEVVEPGYPLDYGTVYNSNKHFILAAAKGLGLPIGRNVHLPDDLDKAKVIMSQLPSTKPQLIITSGAVSAGDRDYMPRLAAELGFEILIHKVAIRPGKPVLVARRGSQIWLGLPGNPLATCCGWYYFARPILASIAGIRLPQKRMVTLVNDVAKPEALRCFYRGNLDGDMVTLHRSQGSAQFAASITSNTYVELPEGHSTIPAKTKVLAITH